MRFQSIFVTGTDTGVGKTTVSCGIAAALRGRGYRVGVCKPAETGCAADHEGRLQPYDALQLRFFSDCRATLETICPYALEAPLAPAVAAGLAGVPIDVTRMLRSHQAVAESHDVTLVEGAGGLMVPMTNTDTNATLALRLQTPLLVVVGSRLGAINHALLTVRYARAVGLRVLGYVVNFLDPEPDQAAKSNVAVLDAWLGPPLGVVPYLGHLDTSETVRDRLAAEFARYIHLDRLLVAC